MPSLHALPFLLLGAVAFSGFAACHHSAFAAETPRTLSPSVDIEVEDRAPGAAGHVARFNVSLSNGNADVTAADGDAKYAVGVHTITGAEPKLALRVKRSDRTPSADIEVSAAIPQQPGGQIVLARVDRSDGRTTTIVARAR